MRHPLIVPSILTILTLALFAPALNCGFVNWDDGRFIYESQSLNPPSIEKTVELWGRSNRGLYIPLTGSAWSLLAGLSQSFPARPHTLNPALFHAASILVHLLSVLTVFSILKVLLARGFREEAAEVDRQDSSNTLLSAGAGALLFAIHPLQVEPVVWVSDLKDLLCGLFSFLAIRQYLSFAFASKTGDLDGRKNRHYTLACLAFLLALLSKPAAVVVPILIFILDRWAVRRTFRQSTLSLASWFIVASAFAVVAKSMQQSDAMLVTTPIWTRPFIAGDALTFYLSKLVLPIQLGIDYGRTPDYILNQWWGYVTWLVPLTFGTLIFFAKNRVVWAVSFGMFAVSLLPVLGFIPFMFQTYSTVADHYLYIPMLGVALAASWLILHHHTRTIRAAILIAVVLLFARSSNQLTVWQNEATLYRNALEVNPKSFVSHNNMALFQAERNKVKEAELSLRKALKIWPDYPDANANLGVMLGEKGKLNESIVLYKKSLEAWPGHPNANRNMGVALAKQGKPEEAIAHYKEALRFEPFDELTHSNLGAAYAQMGNFDEAIRQFSEALRLNPEFKPAKRFLEMAQRERDSK
jgi:Tfp pilus assembly protein PilF